MIRTPQGIGRKRPQTANAGKHVKTKACQDKMEIVLQDFIDNNEAKKSFNKQITAIVSDLSWRRRTEQKVKKMKMGQFATITDTEKTSLPKMSVPVVDPKQKEQYSILLDKSTIK